jgi:predicted dehydrogenase
MPARIRLGVIGLGRRWLRYRAALARLREQVQIRAVCDSIGQVAESVARQLRCAAAGGVIDLLDRNDVDAVLLLDRQWFGLWPLGQAILSGKPVFCATSLTKEDTYADQLQARVQQTQAHVMMSLPWCIAPSFTRLSRLLQQHLGPARFLQASAILPAKGASRRSELLLRSSVALSLFHACRTLLGGLPLKIVTQRHESAAFANVVLELEGGRVAQLTLTAAGGHKSSYRLEVQGDKGRAIAAGPRCLRWSSAEGHHVHRLALPSLSEYLLQRFVHALRTQEPLHPSFDDAYQALLWQRAALQAQSG